MSGRLLIGFVITYAPVDVRWRVSTLRLAGDRPANKYGQDIYIHRQVTSHSLFTTHHIERPDAHQITAYSYHRLDRSGSYG